MSRVTADTNIYISALNFGGKPLQVLELARAGQIELAISNAIITEMSRILFNKFFWNREDVGEAMNQILEFTKYVQPIIGLTWCRATPTTIACLSAR